MRSVDDWRGRGGLIYMRSRYDSDNRNPIIIDYRLRTGADGMLNGEIEWILPLSLSGV